MSSEELISENEIHYILSNEQFILNQDNQLTDVILLDGGQYLIADDNNQTILFQEDLSTDLTQYYIEENNLFENTEIVQLIDNNNAINNGQIVYLTTNEQFNFIDENNDTNEQFVKRIKLEQQNIGFEQNVKIEDGNEEDIDLSKITGKNLINGQIVSLHGYIDNLKKKLKTNNLTSFCGNDEKNDKLNNLLDKKISIGKTKSGKRIIGKIIHVENKNNQSKTIEGREEEEEEEEEEEDSGSKVIVKKCLVTKDSFCEISKTLGGVMEMESVRKKLENKNIVVKLIEKKYFGINNNEYNKTISYSYGYMEKDDKDEDKWHFIPDQNTQEALLNGHSSNKMAKFPITTSLTIITSYPCKTSGKSKTIRVNLNPSPGNLCTICAQYFKTNLQLRHHMNNFHNADGKQTQCSLCGKMFATLKQLQQHKTIHVEEGKLFLCSECNKCFTSQQRLQRHLPMHNLFLKPLECSVCNVRCSNEWSLKKHLLIHTGLKPFNCDVCNKQFSTQYDVTLHRKVHYPSKSFVCDVCLRAFSRHSNLLRHMEIHKGALYKCEICLCTYNYISSLTRHMVENHITVDTTKLD